MQESKNVPLSSPVLLAFYESWLADPRTKERTSNGLCICLNNFIWDELWDSNFSEEQEQQFSVMCNAVSEELKEQFRCAGLSVSVPFNDHYEDYVQECIHSRSHENKLRVEWVQERVKDCFHNRKGA